MKTLLIALAALLIPVMAMAVPTLYLEVYDSADWDPDEEGLPVPEYICTHPGPFTGPLHCWTARRPYFSGVMPLHVAKFDYTGAWYGISQTSTSLFKYGGYDVCPGWLASAGNVVPSALGFATTEAGVCWDYMDHGAYLLIYQTVTSTAVADFTLVPYPVLGYVMLDCDGAEVYTAVAGGGARVGGTELTCAEGETPVTETTWGKIKGLYR